MKFKLISIAGLLLATACVAQEKVTKLYRTFTLSPNSVGVACKSGEIPSVKQIEGFVVVSCK